MITAVAAVAAVALWPAIGTPIDPGMLPPAAVTPVPKVTSTEQPRLLAHYDADRERTAFAKGRAVHYLNAFLVGSRPGRSEQDTVVLPTRDRPYRLDTLARRFPRQVDADAAGRVTLRADVLVLPGATLLATSRTTPRVQLLSTRSRYTTIIGVDATIDLRGTATRPLHLTTTTPTGAPDRRTSDGRGYVMARGGRMDLSHVAVSQLGFGGGNGNSSGMAWFADNSPVTGTVQDSSFTRNHFGMFLAGATDMSVVRTRFDANRVYGFDPHSGTKRVTIADSVARYNGRHGFVFAEGCDDNVIRGNSSFGNGGAGFVIDDGAVDSHSHSDRNVMSDNLAVGNGDTGFVVQGGRGNRLHGNESRDNPFGIWVKDGARDTTITGNEIADGARSGIRVERSRETVVTDNIVRDTAVGIDVRTSHATRLVADRISGASVAALRLAAAPGPGTITGVQVAGQGWHPLRVGDQRLDAMPGVDTTAWVRPSAPQTWSLHRPAWPKLLPWLGIGSVMLLIGVPLRLAARRRHLGLR